MPLITLLAATHYERCGFLRPFLLLGMDRRKGTLHGHLLRWVPSEITIDAAGSAMKKLLLVGLMSALALGGCTLPPPYQPPPKPVPVPPQQPAPAPVETRPVPTPAPVEPAPPPPPVAREPSLSPASKALVAQAQTQIAAKNYSLAAGSLERALRIEPDNPLLWIELGKVRQAEGNFLQAENMGRKAVSMSASAPKTRSAAWRLIADSYRSRGRNMEAQEAEAKAVSFAGR